MISIMFIVLIFSGCSKVNTDDIDPVLTDFTCQFSIEASDISGELEIGENGEAVFTIEAPEDIHGSVITVNSDSVYVEAGGYTKKFDPDDIPEYSFSLYTFNALSSANVTHIESDNGKIYINGTCDNGRFTLYFSQTGLPTEIKLTDIDSTITFNNTVKR